MNRLRPFRILAETLMTVVAAVTVAPITFAQGSLTPPGAPARTMKTLDQIEPRTPISGGTNQFNITNTGSFYLTGNLTNFGAPAILVNASDVTLDLSGFMVVKVSSEYEGAIYAPTPQKNVTIRNG